MCPSCDSADYIEVPANEGLKDLTSGQFKTSPAFNEKRIERERKKAVKKSRKTAHSRKPRRKIHGSTVAGWALVLALGAGFYLSADLFRDLLFPAVVGQAEQIVSVTNDALAQAEESVTVPDRLLPEVQTDAQGPHEFIRESISGRTYFFDPCRPIHWVVNPANEPPGGRELLRNAFQTIQEHTGLFFVEAGETEESFVADRYPRNRNYPNIDSRWNPVIVWWLEQSEFNDASGSDQQYAGFAGGHPIYANDLGQKLVSVTGAITMEATWSNYIVNAGYPQELEWVLVHEIAHVVGLDHVDDPGHLMYSDNNGARSELGPGDIQGLAIAGSEPCLNELEYPQ
jgi:hypothetical protein